MKKISLIKLFIIISLSIYLSSCAIFGDPVEIDETTGLSDYEVLVLAETYTNNNDWQRGVKIYEIAEKRFPNSKYAPQFKLNLAFSYKQFYREEEAILMLNKFIRAYPNHPALDYAYYLKGVVLFKEKDIIKDITRQDISDRDTSQLEESFRALKEMTTLFPKSQYFEDATARMTYLMNKISENELHVARFYLKKEAYLAALNRAKYVIENYQQSAHQEEALVIIISCYRYLGLDDLAIDTKRVLNLNFPNSRFLNRKNDNANDEKKWWEFWDILD